MSVTVDDLAKHLGFAATPADTEALDRALGAARADIAPHLLVIPEAATPDQLAAYDQALLTVAGNAYRSKDAIGGAYMFSDAADMAVSLPRDPLTPVWPGLLAAGIVRMNIA